MARNQISSEHGESRDFIPFTRGNRHWVAALNYLGALIMRRGVADNIPGWRYTTRGSYPVAPDELAGLRKCPFQLDVHYGEDGEADGVTVNPGTLIGFESIAATAKNFCLDIHESVNPADWFVAATPGQGIYIKVTYEVEETDVEAEDPCAPDARAFVRCYVPSAFEVYAGDEPEEDGLSFDGGSTTRNWCLGKLGTNPETEAVEIQNSKGVSNTQDICSDIYIGFGKSPEFEYDEVSLNFVVDQECSEGTRTFTYKTQPFTGCLRGQLGDATDHICNLSYNLQTCEVVKDFEVSFAAANQNRLIWNKKILKYYGTESDPAVECEEELIAHDLPTIPTDPGYYELCVPPSGPPTWSAGSGPPPASLIGTDSGPDPLDEY